MLWRASPRQSRISRVPVGPSPKTADTARYDPGLGGPPGMSMDFSTHLACNVRPHCVRSASSSAAWRRRRGVDATGNGDGAVCTAGERRGGGCKANARSPLARGEGRVSGRGGVRRRSTSEAARRQPQLTGPIDRNELVVAATYRTPGTRKRVVH